MAPSLDSAPVRNGSTALIASTCLALSAAIMSGKGTTTYFTNDGLTPSAFSTAFSVRVWMLLVRLTAMVLPARPAGEVMPGDGRAANPEGVGLAVHRLGDDPELNRALRLGLEERDVVRAADHRDRAVQHVRDGLGALRHRDDGDGQAFLLEVPSFWARYRPASSTTGSAPTLMCDCSRALADDEAELDGFDDPELLQPAASSSAVRPAVVAWETRRRGDLIDAPYVNNGRSRPLSLQLARRRPAAGDKAGPPRQCRRWLSMARHNYQQVPEVSAGGDAER